MFIKEFSKRKLMSIKNRIRNNEVFHPLVKIHPETGLKSYIDPSE